MAKPNQGPSRSIRQARAAAENPLLACAWACLARLAGLRRGAQEVGGEVEAFIYPKTEHGFNNDTTPRLEEAAAKQSWDRTMALFNQTLRG